jgi:hypothetical protein
MFVVKGSVANTLGIPDARFNAKSIDTQSLSPAFLLMTSSFSVQPPGLLSFSPLGTGGGFVGGLRLSVPPGGTVLPTSAQR